MEKSSYLLLASTGAVEFAKQRGVEILPPGKLISKRARKMLKQSKRMDARMLGNAGVVAVDKDGNLAAGTSSGGAIARMAGKSGDCCRIGCSIYADNYVAAVSVSGINCDENTFTKIL